MEPIRVLQVFHGMDCGGAENMVMNLYRKIDRSKIQFDFLVHTKKICFFDGEIETLGGKIYHVPYYNVKNNKEYVKSINGFFKEHPEIKIVHGHLGSCAHIYLKIAKEYGCYSIAHSHNANPGITLKSLIYRVFTYQTRKIADYFIGCGTKAGEYRFGKKIVNDKNKYCVLNNAIDTDSFIYNEQARIKIRNELGINADCKLIGHVGRFNYQKNHEFLIEVFNLYHEIYGSSKLLLVGDGELKPEIINRVNKLNLMDCVIFAGIRNDVSQLLQGMDCFVFPSYYEGFPVTVIEAQAAGLPCVLSSNITREVQITELVQYIDLNKGPEAWAKALSSAVNTTRLNTKKKIVQRGYDVSTTVKWMENFYGSRGIKK